MAEGQTSEALTILIKSWLSALAKSLLTMVAKSVSEGTKSHGGWGLPEMATKGYLIPDAWDLIAIADVLKLAS